MHNARTRAQGSHMPFGVPPSANLPHSTYPPPRLRRDGVLKVNPKGCDLLLCNMYLPIPPFLHKSVPSYLLRDQKSSDRRSASPPYPRPLKSICSVPGQLRSHLERPQSDVETPKPFWINFPSISKANLPPNWPLLASQNLRKSLKNRCDDALYFVRTLLQRICL